jgi:hypothetical protein
VTQQLSLCRGDILRAYPSAYWQQQRDYYQAVCPESRLILIAPCQAQVLLSLTCRLQGDFCGGIEVAVNKRYQCELVIEKQWSHWEIRIKPADVIDGANELTTRWPFPQVSLRDAQHSIANDISNEWWSQLCSVFGDIHSLKARIEN